MQRFTEIHFRALEYLSRGIDFAPDMEDEGDYSRSEYHDALRYLEELGLVTTKEIRYSSKNIGPWSVWKITFQGRIALAAGKKR
jgi:hypothetical protein